jgi:hypothetical protein
MATVTTFQYYQTSTTDFKISPIEISQQEFDALQFTQCEPGLFKVEKIETIKKLIGQEVKKSKEIDFLLTFGDKKIQIGDSYFEFLKKIPIQNWYIKLTNIKPFESQKNDLTLGQIPGYWYNAIAIALTVFTVLACGINFYLNFVNPGNFLVTSSQSQSLNQITLKDKETAMAKVQGDSIGFDVYEETTTMRSRRSLFTTTSKKFFTVHLCLANDAKTTYLVQVVTDKENVAAKNSKIEKDLINNIIDKNICNQDKFVINLRESDLMIESKTGLEQTIKGKNLTFPKMIFAVENFYTITMEQKLLWTTGWLALAPLIYLLQRHYKSTKSEFESKILG